MAIDINECVISGTVIEDPQIVGEGDNRWVFIRLMTGYVAQNPDGSYSDNEQPVLIVSDIQRHVNTAEKYIKQGKALAVTAYYRSWVANGVEQHGMFVKKFIFAKANYGSANYNQ